jgi:PilZ domain
MAEQRREYYRVQYPVIDRPVLTVKTGQFEVIDVSEFGVRFKRNDLYVFEPGMQLVVWIRFSDDSEYQCSGEVLRCDQDSVSLRLHTPIPMKRICAESVYLKLNYGDKCVI